jgi:hypothetical protein
MNFMRDKPLHGSRQSSVEHYRPTGAAGFSKAGQATTSAASPLLPTRRSEQCLKYSFIVSGAMRDEALLLRIPGATRLMRMLQCPKSLATDSTISLRGRIKSRDQAEIHFIISSMLPLIRDPPGLTPFELPIKSDI